MILHYLFIVINRLIFTSIFRKCHTHDQHDDQEIFTLIKNLHRGFNIRKSIQSQFSTIVDIWVRHTTNVLFLFQEKYPWYCSQLWNYGLQACTQPHFLQTNYQQGARHTTWQSSTLSISCWHLTLPYHYFTYHCVHCKSNILRYAPAL